MLCSTIIPTIGRPTLERAVESVLNQDCAADTFEVIVINDSGQPLPAAKWQSSDRVRLIHTNRRNRSVARNSGAAMAHGRYLHFLDDDDWMLPGAFTCLQQIAASSQASWAYGGFRMVDSANETIQEVRLQLKGNCFVQLVASEWLPLQASFIRADAFWGVGGFASLPSLLGGYEDIDLCRQIAATGDIAGEESIVACIRIGDQGSTTDYNNMFNQNRQSREKALALPGAFSRMRASAHHGYWHGRIVYYYLTSMKWNWQRRRLFVVASRGTHMLAALALAGRRLFSTHFWHGATQPHFNPVRTAVEAANRNLYGQTTWR
ncbi:MAG: glycosyltransferase family 2 protein [Anaerolinea sp.]|nr:glycosyltransferase family 2 protein [Anaerolinea sp.]